MTRRQVQLLLIVSAFVVPTLLALLLQTPWFHWEPEATRNRGILITPVIQLAPAGGTASSIADGRRWTVLLRAPTACDEACAKRLVLLSRVREAQGRNMDRVQMRVWPDGQGAAPAGFEPWQPEAAQELSLLGSAVEPGGVMLVDPLGNAMMRFLPDADPSDVRKDLAHMLRWSKIGK